MRRALLASTKSEPDNLPAGDNGLVHLGMTDDVTAAFENWTAAPQPQPN
jgi:hypothetical protein